MQMDIFLIPHFSFTMFPACGLRGGEGPGAWGLWACGPGGLADRSFRVQSLPQFLSLEISWPSWFVRGREHYCVVLRGLVFCGMIIHVIVISAL